HNGYNWILNVSLETILNVGGELGWGLPESHYIRHQWRRDEAIRSHRNLCAQLRDPINEHIYGIARPDNVLRFRIWIEADQWGGAAGASAQQEEPQFSDKSSATI